MRNSNHPWSDAAKECLAYVGEGVLSSASILQRGQCKEGGGWRQILECALRERLEVTP